MNTKPINRTLLNILLIPLILCGASGISTMLAGMLIVNQPLVTYGTMLIAFAAWFNAARAWLRNRDKEPFAMALFCSGAAVFRFVMGWF